MKDKRKIIFHSLWLYSGWTIKQDQNDNKHWKIWWY